MATGYTPSYSGPLTSDYLNIQTVQAETGEFEYLYLDGVEIDLDNIISRIEALEGAGFSQPFDPTAIVDRLTALEGSQFDVSIVDNLSTNVQALQTRIGTLESLIGLLTNNNTNDTAIEHRLTNLEKIITALKAMHEAKKAVYNIPLDW